MTELPGQFSYREAATTGATPAAAYDEKPASTTGRADYTTSRNRSNTSAHTSYTHDTTPEQIAQALGKAKQQQDGSWQSLCPAHEDKNPSFNITTKNGKLLYKCFSGCSQDAVTQALKDRGLLGQRAPITRSIPKTPSKPPGGKPSASWAYHDEDGKVIGFADRYDKPDGGKVVIPRFIQQPGGKFEAKAPPTPQARIYNRHQLKQNPGLSVIIAEGEKAADAAGKLFPGLVAVTWQGGSGAAGKADWGLLAGREAVIWPDADKEGLKAADQVAALCDKAGAKKVRIITPPPGKPKGWDAADAIAEGWTTAQAIELTKGAKQREKPKRFFVGKSKIKRKQARWVVKNIIERNTLAMKFGDVAHGKTFVAIDIVSHIAAGLDWHGHKVERGKVLYIAGEGQRGLLDRFAAWERHHGEISKAGEGDWIAFSSKAADISDDDGINYLAEEIEHAIKEEFNGENPALIVVDTLSRNFGAADENDTLGMRQFVAGLDRIREQTGACILIVHHTGHSDKTRARGSSVLMGALDWCYLVEAGNNEESLKPGGTCVLKSKKAKDHELPQEISFKAVLSDTGYAEEGEPVKSLILLPTGGTDISPIVEAAEKKREEQEEAEVLAGMRERIELGYDIAFARKSTNAAYNTLEESALLPVRISQMKRKGDRKKEFYAIIDRLQKKGIIEREGYKNASRHDAVRWRIVES